jgi:hypothetical protein
MLATGDDLPRELATQQEPDAAGAESEFAVVPGADHVWAGVDPQPVVARTVEFFAERLGAGRDDAA